MCVIVVKDKGVKPLDKKYFSQAWDSNSDGAGVVYKEKDGVVMFQKGFMNKAQFLKKMEELNKEDTAFIAHFRIRSVGEVKPENCHPFVLDHVTFAHNGTIHIEPLPGKTDSETFGLAFLKDKTMDWIKEYKVLLELALGTSKFAIMDNITGEILILNKENGVERDGAWFSNNSAFPISLPTYSYSQCGTYYGEQTKADPWFGEKQTSKYEYFDQNQGCICYLSTRQPVRAWLYKSVVKGENHLCVIDRQIKPNAELKTKVYKKTDKVFKVLNVYKADIKRLLADYKGSTFETRWEKDDIEDAINAKNIVVDCVSRLIKANKEINEDSIKDFIEDNMQRTNGKTTVYGVDSYVFGECIDFLESLK